MKQNFTPDHLLRFLYKETGISESIAIQQALREDATLRKELRDLLRGYQQLPKVRFRPAAKTIQNILSYSARQTVGGEV